MIQQVMTSTAKKQEPIYQQYEIAAYSDFGQELGLLESIF